MNVVTLHPLDLELVHALVAEHRPVAAGAGVRRSEADANRLTSELARRLATHGPIFTHQDTGLSFWEAQVDRSFGMLLRPPSRLFMDAGLPNWEAHAMPIRLDPQLGRMGGAWLPGRLVGKALEDFDAHLERSVKRLVAAEMEPLQVVGVMRQALEYARERGVGLFEAQDLIGPEGQGEPGWAVVRCERRDLDKDFVEKVIAYATPPKKPGLLKRMFGKTDHPNGHIPPK